MKIFEEIRQKVTSADYKTAFDFIAAAMEILDKLDVPGAEKADMLVQYIDKCIHEYDSVDGGIKSELVKLKQNDMIVPFINTVCKVSKDIFKINSKKCCDGKWFDCISFKPFKSCANTQHKN